MRAFVAYLLLTLSTTPLLADGDSWKKILEEKSGILEVYWYPNNITISETKDILDGVEFELIEHFVRFLEEKYDVQIEIKRIRTNSFDAILELLPHVRNGTFAASSISITEERAKEFSFTPPYISDISVLVSNSAMPIVETSEEFNNVFGNAEAITIRNTTLLTSLEQLKERNNIDFNISYVSNSGDIIDKIEVTENGFGYIDLPNFLVALYDNSKVRRQFFHPVKLEGLALAFAKDTDWYDPVNAYFLSVQFESDRQKIIHKYLGADAVKIIERIGLSAEIGPFEEVIISNREKELQFKELLEAAEREVERSRTTRLLWISVAIVTAILFILFIAYRLKASSNRVIEDRNAELKRLNDEKNDLIQLLAHDLRSPLTNIIGVGKILKKSNLSETDQEMNEVTLQSAEKMVQLISKILDVEAIESGNRNMKMEELDISPIVTKITEEYSQKAQRKHIDLVVEVDHKGSIQADKVYFSQTIDNLLSNAIKYSPLSSQVVVATQNVNGFVRVSIKDSGPGFSEEDRKQLFRKYQRLSAKPTAGESSVGLGLSIVKSYTEMMNGKINLDTTLGKGSTFILDFPVTQ